MADEHAVLELVASGFGERAREAIVQLDGNDMFARLVDADHRQQTQQVTVPQLQALRDECRDADPGSGERYWSEAILAEALFMLGDATALPVAAAALSEIDSAALPPLMTLFGRARLRRLVAWSWLVMPFPALRSVHSDRLEGAVSDLQRCGFHEAASFTTAMTAGAHAVLNEEDVVEAYDILKDTSRHLPGDSSTLSIGVDTMLTLVGCEVGDFDLARAAADRALRASGEGSSVAFVTQFVTGVLGLLHDPQQDIGHLERLLAERALPSHATVGASYLTLAHVLADLGHPATARFGRLSARQPLPGPSAGLARDLLGLRVAIAEGSIPEEVEVFRLVSALAETGRERASGRIALRIGIDFAGVDQSGPAGRLLEWGVARVPHDRRTVSEDVWVARLSAALRDVASRGDAVPTRSVPQAGTVFVGVLTPTLRVRHGERWLELGDLAAKLLLRLALSHPTPVHAEELADVLWPGQPYAQVRRRLNTTVYRLRVVLGAGAIRRSGQLVSLDPIRCRTDLDAYYKAVRGPAGQRAEALASVQGNLADAQFPYDDFFVDARHSFAAGWLARAQAAIRAGADGAELETAASSLGIPPDALRPS